MDEDRIQRIGEKFGRALSNFNDFGEFQLALSNAMTYRSYNWDVDEFERVLEAMIEADVSSNPPSHNQQYLKAIHQ